MSLWLVTPEADARTELITGTSPDAGTGSDPGTAPDAGAPDAGMTVSVGPSSFQITDGSNVQHDPDGHIILGTGRTELTVAWLANNDRGTVSKIDTRTGRELARYYSVVPVDGRPNPSGGVGNPNGLRGNEINSPSRIAVDFFGDAWIANRAIDRQGSVTKIASRLSGCRERNGIPGIQTSQDRNGDGVISTSPTAGEMIIPTDWNDPTQYDECVLFSAPVGIPGTGLKARALGISRGAAGTAGDIWVGLWNESAVIKLDSVTGEQVPLNSTGQMKISLPFGTGFGPYGAVVDRQQRLWVTSSNMGIARLALIDTITGTLIHGSITCPSTLSPQGAYGLAIDHQDRVWIAGWTSGAKAFRYTHPAGMSPTPGQWAAFNFSTATSQRGTRMKRARGIAADDQGYVWMTSDINDAGAASSQLIAFDGNTGVIKPFNLPGVGLVEFIDATDTQTATATREAVSVAIDMNGHPWVNNRSGNATRVHRDTGEVLRTPQQGSGLYTYSDFTGYHLRHSTVPSGHYAHVLTGCGPGTAWRRLAWSAVVPTGTGMLAYVTVADTQAELSNPSLRKGPFATLPVDLPAQAVPSGQYLRVEFVLSSSDLQSTPVLKSFDVDYACP